MIIIDCKTPQYGTLGLLIHRRVPSRPVSSSLSLWRSAVRPLNSQVVFAAPLSSGVGHDLYLGQHRLCAWKFGGGGGVP